VEDAVRLGALAVGYTLYVGSPRQDDDFLQFEEVRREAERLGMPVIVWAYPRGSAIEAKGGKESPYAVEYAARAAMEVGADVVKVNIPKYDVKKAERYPAPYREIGRDAREAMSRVVKNVGRTLVIASGGSRLSAEEAVAQAKLALEAGCAGLIFGRNVWQRPYAEGLEVARELIKVVRGQA
jgi:class I fructose-bisphosphate aldolase